MLCCRESKGHREFADLDEDAFEQVKAIGRYWLNRHRSGFRPGDSWGWVAICADDVEMVQNLGYAPEPLPGYEDHELFRPPEAEKPIPTDGPYKHQWDKMQLVTQDDGTNDWQCRKCGAKYKQYGLDMRGRPDGGCHVRGVSA